MSWAEVSVVNGDFLNAPLDIKIHLADYKMYGEDSYVFQQKELLHGLYECTYISMNDKQLSGEALEYLLNNNKHIGKAFGNVYGIEEKETLAKLDTMAEVAASSTAMTAILASSTAMTAILASSTAIASIRKSLTAMKAISESTKWDEILQIMIKKDVLINSFNAFGRSQKSPEGLYIIIASGDWGDVASDGSEGNSTQKQIYCKGINTEWDKRLKSYENQYRTNEELIYRNVRWLKYRKPLLVTGVYNSDDGSTDYPSSTYRSDQEGFLYF